MSYKVYIGNLPEDVRDRDVEKLFKGYGRVDNIVLKVSQHLVQCTVHMYFKRQFKDRLCLIFPVFILQNLIRQEADFFYILSS